MQLDLAEALGVHPITLSRWRRGERSVPDWTIAWIAKAVDVEVSLASLYWWKWFTDEAQREPDPYCPMGQPAEAVLADPAMWEGAPTVGDLPIESPTSAPAIGEVEYSLSETRWLDGDELIEALTEVARLALLGWRLAIEADPTTTEDQR